MNFILRKKSTPGIAATMKASLILLVLMSVVPDSHLAFSQALPDWTPQARIPGIEDQTNPPILLAEQNRTVHAFYTQHFSDNGDTGSIGIFYNQWTRQLGWTESMSILLAPEVGEAWVNDAYLDQDGIIHLIFFGGNDLSANIYYTYAPANRAGVASAWAEPISVGENAKTRDAAFVVDADNNIYILYSGNRDGNGVYFVTSRDGGMRWSDPAPIFLTGDDEALITFGLRMKISDEGWIHAVWSVNDLAGQGRGILYDRYNLSEGRWDEPVTLASAESGLGTLLPALVPYGDNVFVIYYSPKIVYRRSLDYGATWQEAIIPFPAHTGVNGTLSFAIDASNTLHIFMGQRISGSPDTHGLWHSTWNGENWTIPEAIVSGPRVLSGDNNSFDPFDAHSVVSQGNVLLVTWRTDPGNGADNENGVWYSYIDLGIPENPVQASTPSITLIQQNLSSRNPTTSSLPDASADTNEQVDLGGIQAPSSLSWDPLSMLSISIAPVVILILVFAGILWMRRSREQ